MRAVPTAPGGGDFRVGTLLITPRYGLTAYSGQGLVIWSFEYLIYLNLALVPGGRSPPGTPFQPERKRNS